MRLHAHNASTISVVTTSTASNISIVTSSTATRVESPSSSTSPGSARALGRDFFNRGGLFLEKYMARMGAGAGQGPNAAAQNLRDLLRGAETKRRARALFLVAIADAHLEPGVQEDADSEYEEAKRAAQRVRAQCQKLVAYGR